ncbi:FANCD2 opposite strand protein [Hyperolius riggenbachi]|uniref:FANCD2 opposite strand protein n=1 Tax=Hyperolius riggenbachi TaxID=752182 RepID=UPI0035A3A81F
MEQYHLWSPWTPLDENLQWLRKATLKPQATNGIKCISDKLVYELSRLLGRRPPGRHLTIKLKDYMKCTKVTWDTRGVLSPKPIYLQGLEMVFGNFITVQPPKWTGPLRISEKSAFSRVIRPLRSSHGGDADGKSCVQSVIAREATSRRRL